MRRHEIIFWQVSSGSRIYRLDGCLSVVYQEEMGRIRRPKRAKRPRRAPAKAPGLRIQLRGQRSSADLRAMLLQAVDKIEELGITHASGVNLYITPLDASGTPVTPVANGQSVRTITIAEPYRSAAEEYGL